ncbi:hypothetical protein MTO96_037362 [Rhipicephalus appendiculatus]
MQQWVCDHDVLSRCQKGFLPHDGVFEHNFVLQERLDAARAGGGDLCVAFLDFANAFGSVPHNALIDSLRGAGAGEDFCAIVADLYRDNASRIVAEAGTTAPVSISARHQTGLPTERPALQPGPRPSHPSGSGRKLQDRINVVATLAGQLGLRLNPKKCRSLHLSGRTPVGTRATKFFVDGEEIPRIGDYESQAFLGRPVGFSLLPDHTTRSTLRCGVARSGKMEWARLDDALRPLIKKTLYLPGNAANSYLYGSEAAGAAGIPLAAETSDACRVDNAFKLLTSADLETLVCPKEGCYTKYATVNWTSRRQSLLRHLLDEHGMKVTAAYTCTICPDPELGYRPTYHACISRGRHELQANAPPSPQVPGMHNDLPKQERALQSCPSPQEDDSSTTNNHASSPNSSYRDSHDQPDQSCSTCEGHVYTADKAINTRQPEQTAPPALQARPAPQRARREPAQ